MFISLVHSQLSLAHSRDLPHDRRACADQWQTTRQLFFTTVAAATTTIITTITTTTSDVHVSKKKM